MTSDAPQHDTLKQKPINPAIGEMLKTARDMLMHEHSLFASLGLEPKMIGAGSVSFAVDLPEDFAGADGFIHSGLMTLIMDSIFGITVFTALEALKPVATINLRTDYLRKARPGTRAVCTAQCLSVDHDIAHVSGDLRIAETGALIATGAGAFMVGTRGPAPGSRL